MLLSHQTLLVVLSSIVIAATPKDVPAPTCSNDDRRGNCKEQPPPPAEQYPSTCSLWYDGESVYSGYDKLKKGDTVGEPDVVIRWHNHDRWAWNAWHRYSQFYEGPEEYEHVFAPGYSHPLQCHKDLANLDVRDPTTTLKPTKVTPESSSSHFDINFAWNASFPLTANRAIVRGDVVYTTCRHCLLSSKTQLHELPRYEPGYFRKCSCIDVIKPGPSMIPNAGMGAFSKYGVGKGRAVAFAAALHIMRSELHNKASDEHELLLNYVFGHPQTPLLFLPAAPGVNYINHASDGHEPNLKLVWSFAGGNTVEDYFNHNPSHAMFSKSERPDFFIRYEALRRIQPGEELLLDYGRDWDRSWKHYVKNCGGTDAIRTCKSKKPFRKEIGVPDGFFPKQWLENEVFERPKYTWDLEELQPGEIKPFRVKETGETPMSYGHRVGLPANFSAIMRDYADRTGITDIMKQYIIEDRALPLDGTERHRINGGIWWVKRFNSEWESNMHYITPDDERSNTDFMSALGEAGFDQVLQGMGEYFGLDGLICYYASVIAVSHCSGSFPHVDSEETDGKAFNIIFPVIQANETSPELMLGEDGFGPLIIPYRYEPKQAIVLGDYGVHATAPADYRRTKEMRMAISVYTADINEDNRWNVFWTEDMDPPFPPVKTRMRYLMKNAGRHWKKGTDNKLPPRDATFV